MTTTDTDQWVYLTLADGITPVIDQWYIFSVYVKGTGGTHLLWVYDGVSDNYSAETITLTSSWTRYNFSFQAKATSNVVYGIRSYSAASSSVYLDCALLELGQDLGSYFDGNTAGASWDGGVSSSVSTLLTGPNVAIIVSETEKSVNVYDSINISEDVIIWESNQAINVFDSVTAAETVIVLRKEQNVNVFDSITTAETITAKASPYYIDVFSSANISENITSKASPQYINVFSSVNVSEGITSKASPLYINAFSSVNISENITSGTTPKLIDVFDSLTATENITSQASPQAINVFDPINVSEDITPELGVPSYVEINVYDGISVSEDTRVYHYNTLQFKVVNIGSQSTDVIDNTEAFIQNTVADVVAAFPNCTHISFGTYIDYTTQITYWVNAIHAAGKKVFFRSNGSNFWQGTNGETQDTSSSFAANETARYVTWLNTNYALFEDGDLFEPVPDEPENNTQWDAYYINLETVDGKAAFNAFIADSIDQLNEIFISNGVSGVITSFAFTNPSVAKN